MPPRLFRLLIMLACGAIWMAGRGPIRGEPVKKAFRRQHAMLLALGFSRDGSMLVSGGDSVRVHDLGSGEMLHEARVSGLTRAVAFSPSEKDVFVSAGDDAIVRFWRLKWNRPFRTLKEHKSGVLGLAFSPDGKYLATAAGGTENGKWARGEVRLWDTESGEIVRKEDFRGAGASCVAFSRDGKLLAFSKSSNEPREDAGSSLELFEVATWKPLRSIPYSPGFANSLAFLPDGKQLIVAGAVPIPNRAGSMPTGKFWIARTDGQLDEMDALDGRGYFTSAAPVGEGERFVTGTATLVWVDDGTDQRLIPDLQMRETKTGKLIWSRTDEDGDVMYGASVSPDGRLIACCTRGLVLVFDGGGKLVRGIGIGD